VRASELLDYTNYEGDYEFEMGIGKPPEYRPLLENPDILYFAWGATVPMIAHAAGIMLDEITTTWDKWVTPTERKSAKGIIQPGNVAAVRFTINGVYQGETRIQLEHVNRIGMTPPRTGRRATRTTSIASTSRARRAFSRRRRSGSPTVRGATRPPPDAWRPACARSTRCPPSTIFRQAG
jgi:Uncharacterized conserved protein related to dihydrodipicolinate reductase